MKFLDIIKFIQIVGLIVWGGGHLVPDFFVGGLLASGFKPDYVVYSLSR